MLITIDPVGLRGKGLGATRDSVRYWLDVNAVKGSFTSGNILAGALSLFTGGTSWDEDASGIAHTYFALDYDHEQFGKMMGTIQNGPPPPPQ